MRPSLNSRLTPHSRLTALSACRHRTLQRIEGITPTVLNRQSHPDFSPVGWHLGHIAYTEAHWILGQDWKLDSAIDVGAMELGTDEKSDRYKILFAADGLPKAERQNLPTLPELLSYLEAVRSQTAPKLEHCHPQLIHWLLQHEGQHAETIAMVQAMHHKQPKALLQNLPNYPPHRHQTIINDNIDDVLGMVKIKGGAFSQGSNAHWAIDNERPAHTTSTPGFWIDRHPVTNAQFAQFMAMGGYNHAKWWSKQGWAWQQQAKVTQPLYWNADNWNADTAANKPVCGVSWYEADAYARSVGKRLPTESEWEKAAVNNNCQGMFGGVWEWTHTWFDGYAGFRPFPYVGYSQAYFDGEHRVLKGGSWASPPSVIRKSFRNWYHPHRRELFAGFRCAQ